MHVYPMDFHRNWKGTELAKAGKAFLPASSCDSPAVLGPSRCVAENTTDSELALPTYQVIMVNVTSHTFFNSVIIKVSVSSGKTERILLIGSLA